jgi:hypothetical protein
MLLSALTGESRISGLPSWVPDWSNNETITAIALWDEELSAHDSRAVFDILSDHRNLRLRGKIIDTVKTPATAFPETRQLRDGHTTLSARQTEIQALKSWFKMLNEGGDDKTALKFFSKLPRNAWARTQDSIYLDHGIVPKYWMKLIQSTRRDGIYKDTIRLLPTIPDHVQKGNGTYKDLRTKITRFHEIVRTLLDSKTLFRTQGGKFGVGCRALREGDKIALFSGCNLPMVIRETVNDWRIVCPAYVEHAMRNCKAWNSPDYPLRDFVFE